MKILKRLLPYARPIHHFLPEYLLYTFLGILFGLLNFTLLIPVLQLLFEQTGQPLTVKPESSFSIAYIKDSFNYYFNSIILREGKFAALVFVCAIIAAGIALSNLCRYLAIRVLLRLRLRILEGLRKDLYQVFVSQSLSFHHNEAKGVMLQVMTNEIQEIENSVINSLQIILRDPIMLIAYFGILFYWSPTLTLFTIIFLPITGIVITLLTRKLKRLSYFSQEMLGKIMSFTDESLGGIKQIQSYVAQEQMTGRFNEINREMSRQSKTLFARKEMAMPISEVIGVIAAVTLVAFGGYLILNHKTDLNGSAFIAFIALYTQIIPPLKNLTQTSSTLQRGIVACDKIFHFIDTPVTVKNSPDAQPKKGFKSDLSLENVRFAYGQKTVINGITLKIPKGRTLAIVGQSGSGKSTLVDLIARFHDTNDGTILIDGMDIRKIDLNDLRALIGIVSQDTFLFNDTVFNNIALGAAGVTKEEVEAAAKVAYAHDFIMQLEKGYGTFTGERGVKLSGGQRQRISIARAVLKNAPILILDEATSSLDTESEKYVQEALQNLLNNRTSLIIAHRLSTVRHADEIIVLHEGSIRERGTHDQLMALGGYYKRLVDLQEIN